MPKIVKQHPTARPVSASESVLNRIAPVSANGKGIRLNVYGRGKTGKTRLACTFPKPLLLAGTEDGTLSVQGIKGIDFAMIHSSRDLEDITELLKGGKYRSGVLDHAGGFQDIVLKEVLGLDDVPLSKFKAAGKGESWGIADRKEWGTVGTRFKELMRPLLTLPMHTGLHVVVIAHERNFERVSDAGDLPEEASDVMLPSVGAALTPSVAGWLNGACDYICQTFIREEQVARTIKIGGKETSRPRKTGRKEYCLRVGPHPIFMTGFRLPPGVELPDVIVDASYEKIAQLIRGGK